MAVYLNGGVNPRLNFGTPTEAELEAARQGKVPPGRLGVNGTKRPKSENEGSGQDSAVKPSSGSKKLTRSATSSAEKQLKSSGCFLSTYTHVGQKIINNTDYSNEIASQVSCGSCVSFPWRLIQRSQGRMESHCHRQQEKGMLVPLATQKNSHTFKTKTRLFFGSKPLDSFQPRTKQHRQGMR